jgi:uncharacterized protein YehS (DUF1456 family)
MNNNSILRRLRFTFDFNDTKMIELFQLAGKIVTRAEVSDWLKKEEDEEFKNLNDQQLAYFLNGFIILNRGKKEGETPIAEKKLNNNIVFRKLKIALNYRDEDILNVYELMNFQISKHELSAFFRKPDHQHYRLCKDQFIRNFLQGLQLKYASDRLSKNEDFGDDDY